MSKDDIVPLIGPYGSTLISLDCNGAILVEGIENWINGLVREIQPGEYEDSYFGRMKDTKTGAVFLIRRVE